MAETAPIGAAPAAPAWAPGAGGASRPPTPRRLAQQLEASFAAELLRAARPPQKEGLGGRGTGGQAFDSFMDEALGEALVRQGGLGLTGALEQAIARRVQGEAAGRTLPAGGRP
ncbi:rod-binding protein [Pseudoroseomonas cervicalis]|uniref:rod-binding protein n=1 Tax=Teichococcus cervicalis TaxID=204525 RepID=UPI00277F4F6A|nr:rod-binding protein [Pseudoroseomonas cervicalis]MDQ1077577.1 flagellar protein FlgJ [Pseudoroseomonas cervicalis]